MKNCVWLRRNLRLHDNLAIEAALEGADEVFLLYIIEPSAMERCSRNRLIFLYECLKDLDFNLKNKHGNRLLVARGEALQFLPTFLIQHGISRVFSDQAFDPAGEEMERRMRMALADLQIPIEFLASSTLYEPEKILRVWEGHVPSTFQEFVLRIQEYGPPRVPLPAPTVIPPPQDVTLASSLPSPVEFGINLYRMTDSEPFAFGGETQALTQMRNTIANPEWVAQFESTKTNPATITPSTSLLSPYFAYGAISPRLVHFELHNAYRQVNSTNHKRTSDFSSTLFSQIHWREYFIFLSHAYPNFDKIEDNPLCRQIQWDSNSDFRRAFEQGQTGFPWIDACLAQLFRHGWLHHLARHCLSCFLTRGELWQSWEIGRDLFETYLIDYDWSLCNANWIWMSGSGLEGKYLIMYSPVDFARQYDPDGEFIRHYLPALKNFPAEYIFCPWKAPLSVQEKAGCIIGTHYPAPIVSFEEVQTVNIKRLAAFHRQNQGANFPTGLPKQRNSQVLDRMRQVQQNLLRRDRSPEQSASPVEMISS